MAESQHQDRRGRRHRGRSGLLERDEALRAIQLVLDAADEGVGRGLLIEGHAGMGKSRLHEAALDDARARGMRVLRAAGAELEAHMAFGVAAQLLRGQLRDLPSERRDGVLLSAPERIHALLGTSELTPQPAGGDLVLTHGLFNILANAEAGRPALIAVDDLHWSDLDSLGFLLYLLQRLDELPATIVMTRRPGPGAPGADVIDRIAAHPRVRIEKLAPLGAGAVQVLTERALGPRADAAVVAACSEATAGNPFYLHELLLTLSQERSLASAELARHARALAPDAVTRIVRVRVGRLGSQAADLARATAILGEDVPLRQAAALARLALEASSAAADALAAEEILLAREPLRFVHPLVRHAIMGDVPASERATQHLIAARLLDGDGADAERVAAHLLRGRGEADPWVVERLRAAARDALARGSPPSAIRYLRRALDEPPSGDARAAVFADLGAAEATAGLPDAPDHLAQAALLTADPHERAALALDRGRALEGLGRHEQAAHAYLAGLDDLAAEPKDQRTLELDDQLQAGFVATAAMVPSLQARGMERSAQLLRRASATPRTQGQRLLLAQGALQAAFTGEPADHVLALAERAWDGGLLLELAAPQWLGWRMACGAFLLAGALERADEVATAALADARARTVPMAIATGSFARALPRLWQGRVEEAIADIEVARDARHHGWGQFARAAAAHHALCLVERRAFDQAETILEEDGPLDRVRDLEDASRSFAMAELRLAQGRAAEAYEFALTTGEHAERVLQYFGYSPWRMVAAEAALATGNHAGALALAREAVDRSERTGVLHLRIHALRVLGLAEGGERGLEILRGAAGLAADGPPRLERIRVLLDLGAALRRANHRAAARSPLGVAADLARAGGALALQERARVELAATGARPRRDAVLSGVESLTPSERRIAELAAGGQSNREIAQVLFVTPKTVEYHLRNAYRKLGIDTRRQLPEVLGCSGDVAR